jgi:hypothetical protein
MTKLTKDAKSVVLEMEKILDSLNQQKISGLQKKLKQI